VTKPVPEPDDYGEKDVYAFFGLAAFCAQVLEKGLLNWCVALRMTDVAHKCGDLPEDDPFRPLEKDTLAQLLRKVRAAVPVPAALDFLVDEVVDKRNYLSHHFFAAHDVSFMSEKGRRNMIDELRHLVQFIQNVDEQVDGLSLPLWEKLGVSLEMVKEQLQRMKEEAKGMDAVRC
jgi:hypothetical protein